MLRKVAVTGGLGDTGGPIKRVAVTGGLGDTGNPIKKVAVTGGLASGKSTVCQFFKELGAHVISADEIVHKYLSSDESLKKQIVALFGPSTIHENRIDRAELAKVVFENPKQLRKLENILHPIVRQEIRREYQALSQSTNPPPLFIVEMPLLYEAHFESEFDLTVAIVANETLCEKRYSNKTKISTKQFHQRMSQQLSNEEKIKRSDFTVFNNGTIQELKEQIKELFSKLIVTRS